MLKQRIITALILLPIALCGFFLLEGSGFALFIGLVVTLGAWEWARLAGFEAQLARVAFAVLVALLLFGLYVFPDLAPWVLGAAPHLPQLQRHTIPFLPVTGRTLGAPIQLQIMTIQIRVYLHACHKCLSLVHKHCVTPFSKSLNFSLWPSSIHTPATLRFTVTAAQRSALEA